MHHLIFLAAMTLLAFGGIFQDAIWAVLLYYALSTLRPQYMWAWSLPVDLRWSMIAAILVCAGLMLHSRRLLGTTRITLTQPLFLAYGVLLTLSCLGAFDPQLALHWGIDTYKMLLVALASTLIIRTLRHVRLLALMIVAMLGYLAWYFNSLYFFDGRLDFFHYGYGGLDRNGVALVLAIGFPLAVAAALSLPRWWHKALAGAAALLMGHAIMLSYSRGGMLAAAVGVAWLLLRYRPRYKALGMAAICLVLGTILAGPAVRARFLSTAHYQTDGSAQARFESWTAAWHMIEDDPLLGKGIRNSNLFSEAYGADSYGRAIHSVYLQIGADCGLPAMLVYIAILLTALINLARVRSQCLQELDDPTVSGGTARMENSDELLRQSADLALGLEAGLVAFMLGASFLSVEVVELPWLVCILASALPAALDRHLDWRQREDGRQARRARPDVAPDHDLPNPMARPLPGPALSHA